jgi:hypothetical protein
LVKFLARVTEKGFSPTDADGWEEFKQHKLGDIVSVEAKRARNPKQHRLYWALMNVIYQNAKTSFPGGVHDVSDWCKVQVGFCDTIPGRHPIDPPVKRPKHLDYANCPPEVFEPYFNSVIDLVVQEIIPRIPAGDLRRELEDMTGLSKHGSR